MELSLETVAATGVRSGPGESDQSSPNLRGTCIIPLTRVRVRRGYRSEVWLSHILEEAQATAES